MLFTTRLICGLTTTNRTCIDASVVEVAHLVPNCRSRLNVSDPTSSTGLWINIDESDEQTKRESVP